MFLLCKQNHKYFRHNEREHLNRVEEEEPIQNVGGNVPEEQPVGDVTLRISYQEIITPQDETSRSCTRQTHCKQANCPGCSVSITGNHHVRDLSQEKNTIPFPRDSPNLLLHPTTSFPPSPQIFNKPS